jgi:ribonuclease HI
MEARNVTIFGDSKLVVQQVSGRVNAWMEHTNMYREKCLEMLGELDSYHIVHMSQDKNERANMLAQ